MRTNTYIRLEMLYKKYKGYVETREILEEGFSNRQIAVLVKEGYLENVTHGHYWLSGGQCKKPQDYKCIEVYADEADILNVALFGFTAKAWRESNPELAKKNNARDFATINELTVLSNMETHNAHMIREGKCRQERFAILKEIAEYQLKILNEADRVKTQIGSQE